jgi:hypothetical protein
MTETPVKTFNTAGPCLPGKHYMLPATHRLPGIIELIDRESYLVIHAPRQTGKTTFLKALAKEINPQGKYYALYCTLEALDEVADDEKAMRMIVSVIDAAMETSEIAALREKAFACGITPGLDDACITVNRLFNRLCKELDRDLMALFDEADCLANGGTLSTFLGQIRTGYNNRYDSAESAFPRSMALVGTRDIRDCLSQDGPERESRWLAGRFNIAEGRMTLEDFSREQIETLYRQHTEATGQAFEASAVARAWHWSEGHPWLVNALACQAVSESTYDGRGIAVTGELIDRSAEMLVRRRDAHLALLMERLGEPKVMKVMEPIIRKVSIFPAGISESDWRYAADLGLVREKNGTFKPANPIFREAISRHLAQNSRK